uniref:Uncharacterized protein n=1 Tax=Cacopsylla melanoneura TaxID=428564 RepID=A0A8D9BVJ6_9HEMI
MTGLATGEVTQGDTAATGLATGEVALGDTVATRLATGEVGMCDTVLTGLTTGEPVRRAIEIISVDNSYLVGDGSDGATAAGLDGNITSLVLLVGDGKKDSGRTLEGEVITLAGCSLEGVEEPFVVDVRFKVSSSLGERWLSVMRFGVGDNSTSATSAGVGDVNFNESLDGDNTSRGLVVEAIIEWLGDDGTSPETGDASFEVVCLGEEVKRDCTSEVAGDVSFNGDSGTSGERDVTCGEPLLRKGKVEGKMGEVVI